MRAFRLIVLLLLGAAASSSTAMAARPLNQAESSLPNIVIILTDDQGYEDVGVFGARGFHTPNLDHLATEGRTFRNFHVAQAVCSASRAGLLTGCYPNRIGIHGALGPRSKVGISDKEITLAQLVKQRGYATAIFGKWHLGFQPLFLPTRHGFDEYFGLPYSNDMWPHHPDYVNLSPKDEKRKSGYPELVMFEGERVVIPEITHAHQNHLTQWYTERAVKFIETNKSRPFFLYLAHNMPHVPLHASDRFRGKTERGLYGDVIEEIDWSVGEVLSALQRNGLEKNTWVIFTSDNGPWLSYGDHAGSAGPLREGKGTSWEGGTRVPCIMRWPGHLPAGTTSDNLLMTIDLFPTIANQIGAQLPAHRIDGLDVFPLLAGESGAENPHQAYWFYYAQNELQAVASGDGHWKLQLPHTYVSLGGKPGGHGGMGVPYEQRQVIKPELYNLKQDVGESKDVSDQHRDIVERLEQEVAAARAELGDELTKVKGKGTREPGKAE